MLKLCLWFAVRDYCLSRFSKSTDKEKLRKLQRQFISEMLKSQTVWEDVKGEAIPKKQELSWFACDGLQHHIAQAWSKPFAEDETALSWIHHESVVIR